MAPVRAPTGPSPWADSAAGGPGGRGAAPGGAPSTEGSARPGSEPAPRLLQGPAPPPPRSPSPNRTSALTPAGPRGGAPGVASQGQRWGDWELRAQIGSPARCQVPGAGRRGAGLGAVVLRSPQSHRRGARGSGLGSLGERDAWGEGAAGVPGAGAAEPARGRRAASAHSPGQQASLPTWTSSTSWTCRSTRSFSHGGCESTSGSGGTGGRAHLPASPVQGSLSSLQDATGSWVMTPNTQHPSGPAQGVEGQEAPASPAQGVAGNSGSSPALTLGAPRPHPSSGVCAPRGLPSPPRAWRSARPLPPDLSLCVSWARPGLLGT